MFGSTVILGVSVGFLIQHHDTSSQTARDSDSESGSRLAAAIYSAKWSVSSTLLIILVCLTLIALLNRSLDSHGTLKVNSRYLRLLPRLITAVIALCLAIDRTLTPYSFLGILTLILLLCLIWEWTASLESGGGFVEP